MALIDKFLSREERKWTAEDLERLAQQARRERSGLADVLAAAEGKLATLQQAQDSLTELSVRVRDLERFGDTLRNLQERLDHVDGLSQSMSGEYRRLAGVAESLKAQVGKLEEREQAVVDALGHAESMSSGIEDSLSALTAAKTLSRQGEEQLHKLNALSEHVGQKVKALGSIKQAVEKAEVQSHKVHEIVWAVDDKLKKLDDYARMLHESEERTGRLEALHGELGGLLRTAEGSRADFERQLRELQRESDGSLARLRQHLEGSELLRQEIEVTNTRILKLGSDLGRHEQALRDVERRGEQVAEARREADGLLALVAKLQSDVDALAERSRRLDAGEQRLGEVTDLAAKAERQMGLVTERLAAVDDILARLQAVSQLDEATRDRMDAVREMRSEVETVVGLLTDFRRSSREAEGRVKDFHARLGELEKVQARLDSLERVSGDLAGRTEALAPRLEFVAGVEARLNRLSELSQQIDERLAGQLTRQKDLEAMRAEQDGLGLQLADLQKLAATLRSDHTIPEMERRLAELESRHGILGQKLERVDTLETSLSASETRAADLGQELAALGERIAREGGQLEKVAEEAGRAAAQREQWRRELNETEGRQREVQQRASGLEAEVQKLAALEERIATRQGELLRSEERLERYGARIGNLDARLEELDRKLDLVNSRHTLVDRIKREVEVIAATCEKSREDALKVVGARKTLEDADRRMETVEVRTAAMEDRFAKIEKKFASLQAAEIKVDALGNLIGDIEVNLENFREQKAIIDHVAEKLAQAEFQIRRAEMVTRELQEERQLASRIQAGIQSLRTSARRSDELRLVESERSDPPARLATEGV
jgi:chromosome segregation ATPase